MSRYIIEFGSGDPFSVDSGQCDVVRTPGPRTQVVNPLTRLTSRRSVLGLIFGSLAATLAAASPPQTGAEPGVRALGPRHRRPAEGGPGQRHVSESDHGGRPPGPVDSQGRRRLLHDVLVVRRLSGPRHLALPRPGQLAARGSGAVQERRLGLGAGPREAQGALLHLLSRHRLARTDRTTSSGPTASAGHGATRSISRSAGSIQATSRVPTVGGISS